MKKHAILFAGLIFVLPSVGTANAATASDLIDAAQSFVRTGLSSADSGFTPLRGAEIKMSPGEHYDVKTSFGQFFPDCHISGYKPPQAPITEWVLSCASPGLSADNMNALRGLIYHGVIRALPACFTRTLDPAKLRDEDFRWDCQQGENAMSVDVSSRPTSNGHPSFLLEVYEYVGVKPPQATPTPAPTPLVIQLVKPQPTLHMGDVDVPYADYAALNLAVHAALMPGKNNPAPHVVQTVKAGNEMPAFDWAWHYAGKETQSGVPSISVWICGNLSAQEQSAALKQATLMGLLDSGLGGATLQQAYATARDADTALGPNAADPFANRRKLIYSMYAFFR